jgi:hypothetical protein
LLGNDLLRFQFRQRQQQRRFLKFTLEDGGKGRGLRTKSETG